MFRAPYNWPTENLPKYLYSPPNGQRAPPESLPVDVVSARWVKRSVSSEPEEVELWEQCQNQSGSSNSTESDCVFVVEDEEPESEWYDQYISAPATERMLRITVSGSVGEATLTSNENGPAAGATVKHATPVSATVTP
jgi:hypothetical protein